MRCLCLFLILSISLYAQLPRLKMIGKPKASPSETVEVRDFSNRFCSAIRVISDIPYLQFESTDGIVKIDDTEPGLYMVYLPPDDQTLEVYQSSYEPLKLVFSEAGMELGAQKVWVIRIGGDDVDDEKNAAFFQVNIITKPANAQITIDGESRGTSQTQQLKEGIHLLRIVKDGYQPLVKTIAVDENKVQFNFTLQKIKVARIPREGDRWKRRRNRTLLGTALFTATGITFRVIANKKFNDYKDATTSQAAADARSSVENFDKYAAGAWVGASVLGAWMLYNQMRQSRVKTTQDRINLHYDLQTRRVQFQLRF